MRDRNSDRRPCFGPFASNLRCGTGFCVHGLSPLRLAVSRTPDAASALEATWDLAGLCPAPEPGTLMAGGRRRRRICPGNTEPGPIRRSAGRWCCSDSDAQNQRPSWPGGAGIRRAHIRAGLEIHRHRGDPCTGSPQQRAAFGSHGMIRDQGHDLPVADDRWTGPRSASQGTASGDRKNRTNLDADLSRSIGPGDHADSPQITTRPFSAGVVVDSGRRRSALSS
jgi:hypothetical protein